MSKDAKLHVKVPGKLMIAGEYAVLEPQQQAIVTAVNRYVSIGVADSEQHHLHLPDMGMHDVRWTYSGQKVHMNRTDQRLRFVESAMTTVLRYLDDPDQLADPFALTIESELADEQGKKYGLGSSAAIVVGIITALLYRANGVHTKIPTDLLYKLAIIAHFRVQKSGSGADVAAAVFGGWLSYTAFPSAWLSRRLNQSVSISTLVHQPWPQLSICPLTFPPALSLRVGWTGIPATTGPLVQKIKEYQDRCPDPYREFLQASSQAVKILLTGLQANDTELILRGITRNRQALILLGEKAGVPIETSELSVLADTAEKLGGAGKSSGAGAGDCGIAFIDKAVADKLPALWRGKMIEPLSLQVSDVGAHLHAHSAKR